MDDDDELDDDDDDDDDTIGLSSSLKESGSKELPLASARQQDSHLKYGISNFLQDSHLEQILIMIFACNDSWTAIVKIEN